MGAQTSPGPRWSKERKLAYGRRMVNAFATGAITGEKLWKVYPTRLHVVGFFADAFEPEAVSSDGVEYGGYGLDPQDFGAPAGMGVKEAIRLLEKIRVNYVQAVHPDDVRTPGSAKWQAVEDAGLPHESMFNPWSGEMPEWARQAMGDEFYE